MLPYVNIDNKNTPVYIICFEHYVFIELRVASEGQTIEWSHLPRKIVQAILPFATEDSRKYQTTWN